MSELEQRLASVEQELQQLKSSSRVHTQQTHAPMQQGAIQQSTSPASNQQSHYNPNLSTANHQPSSANQSGPNSQPMSHLQNSPGTQQLPNFQSGPGSQQRVPHSHNSPGTQQQSHHLHNSPGTQQQVPNLHNSPPGPQQRVPNLHNGTMTQQLPNFQNGIGNQQIPSMVSHQKNKSSDRNVENILVRYVLPIVFIIILLIGILMLFIAGVAFGLITEPVRCLLGLLLATAMYVTGMLQYHRSKRPILGKALLGGAHGVLIITISVAHLSYELFGVFFAAAFYVLSCALIIYSAIRWRSQLLVCIAIVSAYLCMYLIDIQSVHAIPYLLVQLIISVSMMLLSSKLNYRYANGIAYFLLHFSLIITSSVHMEAANGYLIAALLIQHLIVFIQYMKRKQLHVESHVMQAVGVLAIISWTSYIYDSKSMVFLVVSLLVAAAYAVAILYFERGMLNEEQRTLLKLRIEISALMAAFALICFFVDLLGSHYFNLIVYVTGVSLVLYGLRDLHNLLRWFGAALLGIGTIGIMFDPLRTLFSYEMLCWIVLLASFPIIYRECKHTFLSEDQHNPASVTVWLSTLLWIKAALAFWFITIFGNLIGGLVGTPDSKPYFVSFAWLLYAIIAIAYGTIRNVSKARLTGIILLLVIAFKVVFIDITFLNILIKSILFTVLGGVGILVSYLLYNKTDDKK